MLQLCVYACCTECQPEARRFWSTVVMAVCYNMLVRQLWSIVAVSGMDSNEKGKRQRKVCCNAAVKRLQTMWPSNVTR
jgi:hypothetical protein